MTDREGKVTTYTYDDRGFIAEETAIESLAGYAYDDKHNGRHEDGRHDDLYPHGSRHNGKHDKDATFAYQSGSDTKRVGRWMSQEEYNKMVASGKVQMAGEL